MFPYLELTDHLPTTVALASGRILVAISVIMGHFLLIARARKMGLDASVAAVFSACLIGGGLLIGHWFKFLYWRQAWPQVADNPMVLLNVAFGQASLGGIVGGFLCGWALLHWKVPAEHRLKYLDALAVVFPYPWALGRTHCFLVHDHPGIRTNHWLGVAYPDGTRFDLALIEILFLAGILVLFLVLRRKSLPSGSLCALFLLLYGMFRLLLDSLHVDPIRYVGFTVDQWGAAAAMFGGSLLLVEVLRSRMGFAAPTLQLSER